MLAWGEGVFAVLEVEVELKWAVAGDKPRPGRRRWGRAGVAVYAADDGCLHHLTALSVPSVCASVGRGWVGPA